MRARKTVGAILVFAGLAMAAMLFVPYFVERAGSDCTDYMHPSDADEDEFPFVDWEGLLAVNPDVIGWVHVEGTPIDYPVVQARQDDPQRYLQYALDGTWNGHGCPYVDADCHGASGRIVLTYGHNMLDGTMYSAFASYTDQGYFDEHREILFMTPTKNYKLEAIAAREVSAWQHHPRTNFDSSSELTAYITAEANEAQAVGSVPSSMVKAFEFVCCSYGTDNGRTVVYAAEN